MSAAARKQLSPGAKFALDFGPLLAFFAANLLFGILVATGVLVAAVVIALALTWWFERKIAVATLVINGMAIGFGLLTLALRDPRYIKIKVTCVHALLGTTLLVGLAFGKPLLKHVLGAAMPLSERGWRALSLRWAFFFYALAGLNELVWRNVSDRWWGTFKVFGVVGLSLLFLLSQKSLIERHTIKPTE